MIKKSFSLLIFILMFGGFVYGQQDSISSKELKKHKKLIKYSKTKVFNDTVILSNNNILVGELKNMDRSVLTFKTKYSDSDFKIKWLKVSEIYSDRIFIIALKNGSRFTSRIQSDRNKNGKIVIESGVNTFEENLSDVVFIDPIGKNFLSRLTIDIDFGITVTKANNFKQLSSNTSTTYLANKWNANAYYKTVLSRQDDTEDVKRMDGKISFDYFLKNDWYAQISSIYLSNNDQKLKLRSTYKIGAGYYFIHNNRMFFAAGGGIAETIENYTDDTPLKKSSEVYMGVGFTKYDIGDLSLSTTAILYPSITEKGRYRSDINLDLKYDLPFDFYIKLSISYNFDNQPIEGSHKSDYIYTSSFGWEFN